METREWTFRDKVEWGPGPWQSEPDKRQWTDEATGLPWLIVRGPGGALCGYVGVADGHPWHGLSYSAYDRDAPRSPDKYEASPDGRISVHGGLTFSAFCAEGEPEEGICHKPDPGEPEHVWWFGFDCAHYQDHSPAVEGYFRSAGVGRYRDVDYVAAECASLARQIAAVR